MVLAEARVALLVSVSSTSWYVFTEALLVGVYELTIAEAVSSNVTTLVSLSCG